jgi:FixJ family two-component response regulator
MITGYGDIPMAVRAMQEGAVSFLTKPVREQELLDAIYAGLERHRARLAQEAELKDLHARFETLSPREKEIMPLVVAGLLNKQIAAEVGLSEVTVKVHRHKMMIKLSAKSVPDLVRMAEALAIRNGDSRQRD